MISSISNVLLLSTCVVAVWSFRIAREDISSSANENGKAVSGLELNAGVRQACGPSDTKCWCKKGVEYMNKVRSSRGVGSKLKLGTESQFANAERFANKLAREGDLYHQDLGQASREVGCGRSILGETAAYNGDGGDVARSCVDQWIGSPPHLEIMLGGYEEAVVGFGFRGGLVYCIATFAVTSDSSASSDGKCKPMGGSGGGSGGGFRGPPKTSPSPSPSAAVIAPAAPEPEEPTGGEPVQEEPSAPIQEEPSGPLQGFPTEEPERPPMGPGMDLNVGRNACKCIVKGRRCGKTLEMKTNYQCASRTEGYMQTSACKQECCRYCASGRNAKQCGHYKIRYVCR